jgi:hypothetical protein
MNTTQNTVPPAPELPDYQVAAIELTALFNSTGLTAKVEAARAAIDDADGEKPWPHFACLVTFTDKTGKVRGSLDWKMGSGLIDWAKVIPPGAGSDLRVLLDHQRKGKQLIPAAVCQLINAYLPYFARAVNPAEVLARAAADGEDATSQSFEGWASDYGYDTDSRKAESTYRACQQAGDAAAKILRGTGVSPSQFAEMARRL